MTDDIVEVLASTLCFVGAVVGLLFYSKYYYGMWFFSFQIAIKDLKEKFHRKEDK